MHETSAPVRPSLRCDTLAAVRLPAAEAILGVTIRASAASMISLRVMAASSCRFDAGPVTTTFPSIPDMTVSSRLWFPEGCRGGETKRRPSSRPSRPGPGVERLIVPTYLRETSPLRSLGSPDVPECDVALAEDGHRVIRCA